ncbi:hypothetical protein AB0B63_18610 [Micromonospora sp. NPDC049081]|uniref:hypothetical protein n=1 Tax=Micromonospora sp. NPDC049081 TaxID=3155150 RepID=UPI0033E4B93D
MMGVDWVDPGPAGFVVGGALIAAGAGWLRWSRRRLRAEVTAEVGASFTPGRVRVPAMPVRRAEPVTMLMARVSDAPDATQVMPAVRRG